MEYNLLKDYIYLLKHHEATGTSWSNREKNLRALRARLVGMCDRPARRKNVKTTKR
jgi:hypothetical protein